MRCHKGQRTIPKHPVDWINGKFRSWTVKQENNRAVWRFQQHILYNLTNPEQSVQLLAPLAKNAGGYGTCLEKVKTDNPSEKPAAVFESKDDPDYKILLAAIKETKALHDLEPRWDLPGWTPPVEYVREMKRHGIIDETFNPDTDTLDPFETDRRYWEAVTGHHLPGKEPKLYANPKIKAMCIEGTLTNDGN